MSTLIVYGSRYGCSRECAELIREKLGDDEFVIFTRIDCQEPPTVSDYDRIIIGGSIRYGKIQRKLRRFIETYRPLLLEREIGLYLCCLSRGEDARKLLDRSFPHDVIAHAKAVCFPGGSASLEDVHPVFRKLFTARHASLDTRDNLVLDHFVRTLQEVRKTSPVS